MNNRQEFDKKIFTAGLFLNDIGFLVINVPRFIEVFRNKNITKVLVEKIMTVTTAVNGCLYCAWFHAKQAIESGISEAEVRNMLNLQFHADASEFELLALLYAQHFAETNRKPEPEMTRKLFDFYGDKTANHIILLIRMIFFGNLYGNTWDAAISRFNGKPAKNSCIIFEIFFFLLNFLIMFPAMLLLRKDKKKGSIIL